MNAADRDELIRQQAGVIAAVRARATEWATRTRMDGWASDELVIVNSFGEGVLSILASAPPDPRDARIAELETERDAAIETADELRSQLGEALTRAEDAEASRDKLRAIADAPSEDERLRIERLVDANRRQVAEIERIEHLNQSLREQSASLLTGNRTLQVAIRAAEAKIAEAVKLGQENQHPMCNSNTRRVSAEFLAILAPSGAPNPEQIEWCACGHPHSRHYRLGEAPGAGACHDCKRVITTGLDRFEPCPAFTPRRAHLPDCPDPSSPRHQCLFCDMNSPDVQPQIGHALPAESSIEERSAHDAPPPDAEPRKCVQTRNVLGEEYPGPCDPKYHVPDDVSTCPKHFFNGEGCSHHVYTPEPDAEVERCVCGHPREYHRDRSCAGLMNTCGCTAFALHVRKPRPVERKCVQTLNAFGYPLVLGCDGPAAHVAKETDAIPLGGQQYRMTSPYHVALYEPAPLNPSHSATDDSGLKYRSYSPTLPFVHSPTDATVPPDPFVREWSHPSNNVYDEPAPEPDEAIDDGDMNDAELSQVIAEKYAPEPEATEAQQSPAVKSAIKRFHDRLSAIDTGYKAGYAAGIAHASRWTPVSERLPGMYVPVIVTVGDDTVLWGVQRAHHGEVVEWEIARVALANQQITAWQPLPAPYRPEEGKP
jgi:hypothetical protein